MTSSAALPWRPYPALSDAERIDRAAGFSDRMATRRSCRSYSERPIPREVIEAALKAATSAPSGANRQPWHFCAIESAEAKAAIRVAMEEEDRRFYGGGGDARWLDAIRPLGTGPDKAYLEDAAWLIAVFGVKRGGMRAQDVMHNQYVVEGVGIACGLLLATLHEAGVATLVHTPGPAQFLNHICRRPASERPIMLIVAGHPADDATIPADSLIKKAVEQSMSWL